MERGDTSDGALFWTIRLVRCADARYRQGQSLPVRLKFDIRLPSHVQFPCILSSDSVQSEHARPKHFVHHAKHEADQRGLCQIVTNRPRCSEGGHYFLFHVVTWLKHFSVGRTSDIYGS